MRRAGSMVPVYSCDGQKLRHVKRREAFDLLYDPQAGYEVFRDGIRTNRSKFIAKNETACSITAAECQMNATLKGETPRSVHHGWGIVIDPVTGDVDAPFAAKLKVAVWPEIGNVIAESTIAFCPWPPVDDANYGNTYPVEGMRLQNAVDPEVRDSLLTQLKIRNTFA
jgi:hypothetical protein